jgi:predicted transcriptional regulator
MKDVVTMREHIKETIDNADEDTVARVFHILTDKELSEEDLLNNLSPEQEASLRRGIKDADEGRVTPHDEVMKKYEQWLTK